MALIPLFMLKICDYFNTLTPLLSTPDQPLPKARTVLAPAGELFDTKTLGLYTLFPGHSARPFPRAEMKLTDPESYAKDVAFWEDHRFIAHAKQVVAALAQALEPDKAQGLSVEHRAMAQAELERVRQLHADYRAIQRRLSGP